MPNHAIRPGVGRIGAIVSAFGLAAVLALTVVTQAGSIDTPVPFSAFVSGTVAFTSQTTVAFNGAGQASHMGRSSNAGITTITGGPDAAGCVPNLNSETLTAANGDQLMIQSNDLACPIGPTSLHGSGNWVVVGGTGRFANATGSGTLDGVSNFGPEFSPGTFYFTLTGSLSLNEGRAQFEHDLVNIAYRLGQTLLLPLPKYFQHKIVVIDVGVSKIEGL